MNIRVCHVACHFTFPRTEFQLQPWGTDARALLAQFPIVLFSLIEKLFGIRTYLVKSCSEIFQS